jgi:small-conductance mechanosensitive channel
MESQFNYLASAIAFGSYFILRRIIKRITIKHAQKKKLLEHRVYYVTKLYNISSLIILFLVLALIWGISFSGIYLFAASFFAIAGIGFFASWSILSNITASIILFIHSPFKIGSEVRILDGENSIEGKVIDITLFSVIITTPNQNKMHYPNNLAIQKPIITTKYE